MQKTRMICRLCLKEFENIINIFDDNGQELNVAEVVGKHFWFEPRRDDPISTSICKICWVKVCDFHEFYKMVEDSHRHMTERFIVKSESVRAKRRPSLDVNNLINYSSLPSKREPDDEFDELGEVPFNMLMDDTTDEPGKTVAKAAAIALGAEDSHDLLSNHNFSQDECDNASQNGDEKLDRPSQTPDCENDISFDGEAFMNNILTNKNEQTQSRPSTKTDRRRSTRNVKKC
ncbi:hypothetical protein DOY81_008842 [Sarcophaga bullata]|nr:hypothetical protein DOY81_008842 [Sarcophaga bullata]